MIRISKDKQIDRQRINYGYEEKISMDKTKDIQGYGKINRKIYQGYNLDRKKDISG